MGFDLGAALETGLRRTATRAGVVLVGALFAVQVASGYTTQSIARIVLLEYVDWSRFLGPNSEITQFEVRQAIEREIVVAALDLPIETLLAAALALWLVGVVVRIGAIRWFVGDESAPLNPELFTRRLGWTIANLIVGFLLYALAVVVGLVVFVVPGVFLAVALFFYNYEIIVEGENAIDALRNSYALTAGNRVGLFLLGLVFALAGGSVGFLANPGLVAGPAFQLVVNSAISAAFGVVGIAVAATAYTQLTDGRQSSTDDDEWTVDPA